MKIDQCIEHRREKLSERFKNSSIELILEQALKLSDVEPNNLMSSGLLNHFKINDQISLEKSIIRGLI